MTALFIVAIGVFAYICYVLLKPENFKTLQQMKKDTKGKIKEWISIIFWILFFISIIIWLF